MSSASPKRNRSKVQKKGSHGGSRDGAGRKPSSSKLAVAAKGTFTLHTMGFNAHNEADDGTATCSLASTAGSKTRASLTCWARCSTFATCRSRIHPRRTRS